MWAQRMDGQPGEKPKADPFENGVDYHRPGAFIRLTLWSTEHANYRYIMSSTATGLRSWYYTVPAWITARWSVPWSRYSVG
jgi:hypothetical protein